MFSHKAVQIATGSTPPCLRTGKDKNGNRNVKDVIKIKLDPVVVPVLRSQGMNWAASATKPFDFQPTSFTSQVEGLRPKRFNTQTQVEMLRDWLGDTSPGTFGVNSAPTDAKALLLAAFMMQENYKAGGTVMKWYDLTGGFDCPLLTERANVSLLVLNNVAPDSSQTKKEKLRDILTVYADTPKIVVVNGMEPYRFFTEHLRMPLHGLCYLTNASVKGIDI